MNTIERARTLLRTIPGVQTSDGAGVRLRRSIGAAQGQRLDPSSRKTTSRAFRRIRTAASKP